jgi:hypothetical protein
MNTFKSFFVHWKTSLCGIVVGAINLYASGATLAHVAVSVGIAVLGLLSSDGDKAPGQLPSIAGAVKSAAPILLVALMCGLTLVTVACAPIQQQAYDTIVGAKAFIDSERTAHPECATGTTSTVCSDLAQATSAKDLLIDALEVYCAGPQFATGGACQAPAKGTDAYTQALAKLQAAIAGYNQAATNLKGAI